VSHSHVRRPFARLPDGSLVESVTLSNDSGLSVTIITLGATLQSVLVPGRNGAIEDVVLGHDDIAPYLSRPHYFGATIGRVANRIAGGRFWLDGTPYRVVPNNGPNALHGGQDGFDRRNWKISDNSDDADREVTLTLESPDGDQGFPGTLNVSATYRLDQTTLSIRYRATTDKPTLVNITNHTYWNLGGIAAPERALQQNLLIPADIYLPVDQIAIPTGEFRAVEGTAFDFRTPSPIGARLRNAEDAQLRLQQGYDHNWAVDHRRAEKPRLLARLEDTVSGRALEVLSTEPGVQFYSGNFLDGTLGGKRDLLYRQGDGIALEPQMFPDAPNQPEFGSIRLDPAEVYDHRMIFRFS
jgi:aldose 1-epimerase